MPERKKKRTMNAANGGMKKAGEGAPKSMVIRIGAGEVGSSVSQLVKDVRHVMEPGTASRLKERRANKLRDYTTMSGPLGVSHLLLFSRSATSNTNMRLARTPRGPTLHFRVEKYSLCKDVMRAQKHPRTAGPNDFLTAPLLVMNNFLSPESTTTTTTTTPAVPRHLERLVTDMFQSLFPPIAPQTTPLSSIRRVLLLNREPAPDNDGTYTISLRHYSITTKQTGLSKAIRRLHAAKKLHRSQEKKNKRGLPNLGNLEDVADFMLDPSGAGYTSASDTEIETDAEVEVLSSVTKKVLNRRDMQKLREAQTAEDKPLRRAQSQVEKRAVKLVELGPRLRLRLTKVEDDMCTGKVLWHEYIEKSKEEVEKMDEVWEKRHEEKAERKRIQKENVERKRKERGEKGDDKAGEDEEMEDYDPDLDDDEWDEDAGGVEVEDEDEEPIDEDEDEDENEK